MTSKNKYLITLITLLSLLIVSAYPSLANNVQEPIVQELSSETPSADAMVSIAHFAPFGMDTSVSVYLNGAEALTEFEYGDIVDVELAPGEYLIEIEPTGSGTVAISGTVTLSEDMSYTLAAIGDGSNQDLELFPMVNETDPLSEGAKLRAAHLAPFTAGSAEVDICTDDGTVLISNFAYKQFTDPYLNLPAGSYDLLIAAAGSSCAAVALDIPAITLHDGDIVDVFAIGGANGFALDIASTTGFELTTAPVSVAHFAPFGPDTSVSVYLNGEEALSEFLFADIVDVDLPIGDYLVEIEPTGSGMVAISGTVTLEAGMSYTLAAIGDGSNQILDLFPMVDETEALTDSAKLRVTHLAPFASGDAEVDICTDDGTIILPNFGYKDFTDPYLQLTPGDYDLAIALAGTNCGTIALDIPSIRISAGDIVDVFATGGANGYDLQIASTTGVTLTPPARVNIAHFAPFASDMSLNTLEAVNNTAVTITINGSPAIADFLFGDYTGYLELEAGDYLVEVIPVATGSVALSGTLSLEAGMDYTVAAIGGANSWDLEFYPLADDNSTPPENSANLRISHLAPFAEMIEDTEVDICTEAGDVVADLSNVPYKATTGYLNLPTGDYDLKVTASGTDCGVALIDVPSVRLVDGDIVDVFAIGDGTNQPVGVASTTGFTLTPANVSVAHLAPFAVGVENTSVTVRVNGADALTDFLFGDITPYLEFAPGETLIEILPSGTSTVAISGTFTLDPAMDYTLSAIGDGSNQPLELFPLIDDNTAPMQGMSKVRVVHFAPFASSGTEVDICTQDGTALPGLMGIPYKGYTDPYMELPSSLYDLKVTAAGSDCGTLLFDIPTVALKSDMVSSIFAVGGANEFAPTVITVPDLTPAMFYLPILYR